MGKAREREWWGNKGMVGEQGWGREEADKLHLPPGASGKRTQGERERERPGREGQSSEGGRVEGRAKRCEDAVGERGSRKGPWRERNLGRKPLPTFPTSSNNTENLLRLGRPVINISNT